VIAGPHRRRLAPAAPSARATSCLVAVAFAAAAAAPGARAATVEVLVKSNFFDPAQVTISAGDTVVWRWVSGFHTVTSGPCDGGGCSADGLFESGLKSSGTFLFTFTQEGIYPYFCIPHAPGMSGFVTVSPPPPLSCAAQADPAVGNPPLDVQFTANPSGGVPSYSFFWLFDDGTAPSTGRNPLHRFTALGVYDVNLTVTDSAMDSAQCSVQVVVTDLTCSAAADPNAGEAPLGVTLTGSASGGTPPYAFSWSFDDGTPADANQVADHTFAAPGTYDVTLSVQDGAGVPCTAGVTVTALSPPCGANGDDDGDEVCDGSDVCPAAYNPAQEDADQDGAGDLCDVCPSVPDPGQEDLDQDGDGNACDLTVTSPMDGTPIAGCSVPPTIMWAPGGLDRFKVQIAWDPSFAVGARVGSGDRFLRSTFWIVPARKWRKACNKALASGGMVHVRAFGKSSVTKATEFSEPASVPIQ
jgi:plastocyanin